MRAPRISISLLLVTCLALLPACADKDEPADSNEPSAAIVDAEHRPNTSPGKLLLTPPELGLPAELVPMQKPWFGDFDAMVERRLVRVLTVYQAGGYYLDGLQEKGLTYELVKMFEAFLNDRLGTGHVKTHVVLIPVEFDQLLPALVQGYGDIAVAGLTITPGREKIVDFSEPLYENASEIVITGPAAPQIGSLDDLSGQQVYIKPGSSYRGSLETLNSRFRNEGRKAIKITDAPPHLQDVDLLEMVSAELLPMVVMDDFKARFWANVMDGLTLREDLVIGSDRSIGWAMRKDSPVLKAQIDEFARDHRKGTLMGNILIKRYLKDTGWIQNVLDPTE